MWRSLVATLGFLILSALLLGGGCAPKPQVTLCFFDKDCPGDKPKCTQGVCAGSGESGGNTEGVLTDGGGADTNVGGPCTTGQRRSCYSGPQSTENRGVCRAGEQLCVGAKWDTCDNQVVPSAEVCDGVDNNCDGVVDEGCAQGCTPGASEPCYTGAPNTKGKGICKPGTRICLGTKQWGACTGQVIPAAETCDGLDNNCDGVADENCGKCVNGTTRPCYTGPANTKGVGICKPGSQNCSPNGAWTACFGQYIPRKEVCNKADDNCNGQVDESCQVCNPGATVPCYLANAKGCTLKGAAYACVGTCKSGIKRCDPTGQWGHCEGAIGPRGEECDGKDDDCNGQIDDNLSAPNCEVQHGACAGAVRRCNPQGGWFPCLSADYARQNPKYKTGNDDSCDGIDNNCSGTADEACGGCTPGQQKPCYSGHPSTQNKGNCKTGVQNCTASKKWSICFNQVLPKSETCNNVDDDCDGYVDEAYPEQGKACSTGRPGLCAQGLQQCAGGKVSCQSLYQPRIEICNGKDDDCNGQIDDNAQTATYYRDFDGDNYGDPKLPKKACLRPAGYVSDNTDCYDKNSQVRPGQPGFFVNHRGDGSFDYNCDGQETKRFTQKGDCKQCKSAVIDIGFLDQPACGKPGRWLDKCFFDVGACKNIAISKKQECR